MQATMSKVRTAPVLSFFFFPLFFAEPDLVLNVRLSAFCPGRFGNAPDGYQKSLKECLNGLVLADLSGYTEEKLMAEVERAGGPRMQVPAWLEQLVPDTNGRTLRSYLKSDAVVALSSQLSHVSLSRKSVSPEKPLGEEIEMSVEGLLRYCRGKQVVTNQLNLDMMCHDKQDAAKFELSGRAHAVEIVGQVMRGELKSKANDRIKHPIMVCCGLSGLGKTRMLEEWDLYWSNAGITGKRAAVLVLYENGHGLRSLDSQIGWEASVAWRFLHRVFLEDNMGSKLFDEWFRKELPKNASQLTMAMAIMVLQRAMFEGKVLQDGEELSLFIGIDEYQKIADFESLLPALGKCTHLTGIKVFFMMAGLEWGPLSLARSSNVYTKRIPMSLLDTRSAESMLDSNGKSRVLLSSIICRRHVFFLGGVPRFVEQYAKAILGRNFEGKPDLNDESLLKRALDHVFTNFVHRAWIFKGSRPELLLVAYALCGRAVKPDDVPGIAVGMKAGRDIVYPDHLNWRQLSDTGVCLLVQREKKYYVHVPYNVMGSCGAFDPELSFSEKLFVRSIEALCTNVDAHLFALEPWQLWERFGACFHALRINALLVVNGVNEMVCPLSDVFAGSKMDDTFEELEVKLRPVKLLSTSDEFSTSLPRKLKRPFSNDRFDWLEDIQDGLPFSCVVINGTNGQGVDVLFALKKAIGNGYYVVTDQRKRVAVNSISARALDELVNKASIVPACVGADSEAIVGIFNAFPQQIAELPKNSFFVGANETECYHGCLSLHPASDPRVFINSDHESALALVSGIGSATAKKIIARREKELFESVPSFLKWLKLECRIQLKDDQINRLVVS
jgi:hypothetical protein